MIEIIENSTHDIDGAAGLTLECQKLQKSDEFKDEEEVKKMQFSYHYVHRLLRNFLAKITRSSSTQMQMTPEKIQLEDARVTSIMAPFAAEDIYNSDEVHFLFFLIMRHNFSPVCLLVMRLKVELSSTKSRFSKKRPLLIQKLVSLFCHLYRQKANVISHRLR